MDNTLTMPKWVTDQFFRPTDTLTNLNKMRKAATNKAVANGFAVIHHHGTEGKCTNDQVHEYFGFGPHGACDGVGCDGCDEGWRKH